MNFVLRPSRPGGAECHVGHRTLPEAALRVLDGGQVPLVLKGGKPAAGPNRKKHWNIWVGRRVPAALLRPAF